MKNRLFYVLPLVCGLFLSSCGGDSGGGGEPTPEQTQFTITFKDESNNVLESKKWDKGVVPSYNYTKQDTDQWHYTVLGWAESLGGSVITIPAVSKDQTYWAVVNKESKKYDISFYREDNTLIETKQVGYGQQPSCSYTGPQDDKEWNYTFLGWKNSAGTLLTTLPTVTGSASYYASVEKTKNQYTITFDSNGGSTVSSITNDYGTQVDEPVDPTKDGYKFVAWTTDSEGKNTVTWPYTISGDVTLYAQWNEVVNIKTYFNTLISAIGHDPFSYIPETMQPTNSKNYVNESSITYDFNNFNSVSSINYGGFGEQWHMVVENIKESERFYKVLSIDELAINSSVILFNNWLDNNPGTTASHSLNETTYTAKIDFHNGVLMYSIQYKTNLSIPLFGEVAPQIDMIYNIADLQKTVRIQLNDNNAMKYIIKDNYYSFVIEYGLSTVSRKAYFQVSCNEDKSVEGHVYEFVQFKDKDLVPSCADFYIGETYTSVVGNKASGIIGFAGYINELYSTTQGKLIGYKVRETFNKWGIEKTYNTLWFNLNNITGINSVKAIDNGGVDPHENNHDIYLNGSGSKFVPTRNKYLFVSTSRRYDVEMRKRFFYGLDNNELKEYEITIPMMFIQDDGTESGETNYSTFETDILEDCGIAASVNLANTYLEKIREDYLTLIDIFIANKDSVNSQTIENYIGEPITLD